MMIRPIRDVEAQLATSGVHARLQAETRKQVVMKAAERQRNTAAAADAPDKQNKMWPRRVDVTPSPSTRPSSTNDDEIA
jgi:hypothetical protein